MQRGAVLLAEDEVVVLEFAGPVVSFGLLPCLVAPEVGDGVGVEVDGAGLVGLGGGVLDLVGDRDEVAA